MKSDDGIPYITYVYTMNTPLNFDIVRNNPISRNDKIAIVNDLITIGYGVTNNISDTKIFIYSLTDIFGCNHSTNIDRIYDMYDIKRVAPPAWFYDKYPPPCVAVQ
jgi:hypothetical protein